MVLNTTRVNSGKLNSSIVDGCAGAYSDINVDNPYSIGIFVS